MALSITLTYLTVPKDSTPALYNSVLLLLKLLKLLQLQAHTFYELTYWYWNYPANFPVLVTDVLVPVELGVLLGQDWEQEYRHQS